MPSPQGPLDMSSRQIWRSQGDAPCPEHWMGSVLLTTKSTDLVPPDFLASIGDVFARFDRQDSGNISFGVETAEGRHFVKTAGPPGGGGLPLAHKDRVALLHNAERLAREVPHPALTRFERSIPSAWGPMLVYGWVEGEHLHALRERRDDPDTAWQRFLALPTSDRLAVVRTLIDLHVELAKRNWVTGDFYDGCLIYNFPSKSVHVFDLDSYHQGPYRNNMGRMFGSTRFMAPEEFELGRAIDERTTVFALGRTIAIFLSDLNALSGVVARACATNPNARYSTVAELARAFAGASNR